MTELIFAYFGAVTSVMALSCLLSWLWLSWRKDINERANDARREKLEKYDEFAKELNSHANILEKDDWYSYSWGSYNFEKLTKEMIELRKFKKNHENTSEEIGG